MFKLKPSDQKKIQYDEDMRPLSDILQISVKFHSAKFESIVSKYQNDFLKVTAQSEFDIFLKKVLEDVRKMISIKYKKNTLDTYFTEYGQVMVIYDALKTLFMIEYETLSKSF